MDAKHYPIPTRKRLRMPIQHAIICALVGISCMALLCLPQPALAVDYGTDEPGKLTLEEAQKASDITPEIYNDLGLTMSPDIPSDSKAPLPENRAIDVISNREVYITARGDYGSIYLVRDYLERLGPSSTFGKHGKTNDGNGSLYGAYYTYGINEHKPYGYGLEDYGSTYDSYFSANEDSGSGREGSSVLHKGRDEFEGKYATSVAFSVKKGKDAKDDHVAEIWAYASDKVQQYEGDGKNYPGRIELKIFSVSEGGIRTEVATLVPALHKSQILDSSGYRELMYLEIGYQQEYDAYFELEAADVDGDGIDELFMYSGAYEDEGGNRKAIVYMFKSENGSDWALKQVRLDTGPTSNYVTLSDLQKANPNPWYDHHVDLWRHMLARTVPVVTIKAGDLDRNGTEEVAFVTSAPTGHKKAADAAVCRIFHWDKSTNTVSSIEGLDNIRLNDAESSGDSKVGRAMMSANATFGTFLQPTELAPGEAAHVVDAFFIAGWESKDSTGGPNGAYENFAYCYLYYDIERQEYVITDYVSHPLGKDGLIIAKSAANKAGNSKRYTPVMAPFALCSANLYNLADSPQRKSDYILAGGDVYRFVLSEYTNTSKPAVLGRDPIGSMSLFSGQYHNVSPTNFNDNKAKDHIWIGDVVSGIVSNDNLSHESFLAVIGVRRDDDVSGSDDYYWMDVAHFTFEKGRDERICTGQEGVICESPRMRPKSGPHLSLCLPDIDNDSVRMYYYAKALFPTAPQVLAVLQDTPYFGEVEDTYHYLSASATSIGQSTSTTVSKGFNISFAAGGHLSAAWGEGPAFQLDVAVKGGLGYDLQRSKAMGQSCTYTAVGGGGNKVVTYAIPVIYYLYKTYNPSTGDWDDYYQTAASDPVTSVVSVDYWNSIAAKTNSLPTIGKDIIASESGNLESYKGTPSSTNTGLAGKEIITGKGWVSVSSNGGDSNISQGASEETGKSHTVNPALQLNITTGFGFGLFGSQMTVGPVVDFAAGYESSEATTRSLEFGGTVDNMPQIETPGLDGDKVKHYAFQWQLKANSIAREGKDKESNDKKCRPDIDQIYLVGYNVDNVTQPDLRVVPDARIDSVTDKEVTLSWLPINFGSNPNKYATVYRVGLLSSDGKDVSRWETIDAPAAPEDPNKRVEYIYGKNSPLEPYREHSFVVVAALGEKQGTSFVLHQASIPSPTLKAWTLKEGETIAIIAHPQNLPPLEEGADASYSIEAKWTEKGVNKSNEVYYTWQVWNRTVTPATWTSFIDGKGDGTPSVAASSLEKYGKPIYDTTNTVPVNSAPSNRAPLTGRQSFTLGNTKSGDTSVNKLTVTGITEKVDGVRIRCNAGYGEQVIHSSEVVLKVKPKEVEKAAVSQMPATAAMQTSIRNAVHFFPARYDNGGYDDNNPDNDDDNNDNNNNNNNNNDDEDKKKDGKKPSTNGNKAGPKTSDAAGFTVSALGLVAAVALISACFALRRLRKQRNR